MIDLDPTAQLIKQARAIPLNTPHRLCALNAGAPLGKRRDEDEDASDDPREHDPDGSRQAAFIGKFSNVDARTKRARFRVSAAEAKRHPPVFGTSVLADDDDAAGVVSDVSECDDDSGDCEIVLAFASGNTWNKVRSGVYRGAKMKRGKISLADSTDPDANELPKFERMAKASTDEGRAAAVDMIKSLRRTAGGSGKGRAARIHHSAFDIGRPHGNA